MAELIRLPKMGLTMEEGTIVEWFVEEGQEVKKGERFFEVATDKISNEIEAEFDTTLLKIIVAQDEDALVQAPIAIVGEAGEDYSALMAEAGAAPSSAPEEAAASEEAPAAAAASVPAVTRAPGEYVLASPLAKKTAKEKGVDLAMIAGTGPNGRVVEKDVLAAGNVKASPMAKIAAAELGVNIASIQKDGRIMKDDVQ
ncbi:MAG TPA: E3 binding domain-containing protein, partial [Clostridia bacterium]|nr:E3 binding domain-containing protein [Clostridia bacterium]